MLLSQINEEELNNNIIDKILFDIPEDDLLPGDCIWVFGSKKYADERVEVAVKLFNDKRAPYILFSGGFGKSGTIKEALLMRDKAISLGVPSDRIFIEDISCNTTENVLCSLLVLERKFLLQNIKRLIVVSSQFHIQRLILTLSRYMPKWIEYSYSYNKNTPTSKVNWVNDINSSNVIYNEAKGIIFYAKEKYIDDKEINLE